MNRGRLHQGLGRRVRKLRTERGLSQEKLAEKAGIHTTYLSDVERGLRNPSLTIIGRLAKALGVSLSELFDGLA